MTWFMNNLGTIITFIILATVVILIIRQMKKDKAEGKSSCGAGCKSCAMHGKCGGCGGGKM